MPKLVVDPKGRYSWEANFNPVLRMSHNAITTGKFKMDVERAKYMRTLKMLDGNEKAELKITQKEVDQVREELCQLKAYKKVAELTAFKRFDPVLRRQAEQKALRDKNIEAAEQVSREIAAQKEDEEEYKDDGVDEDVSKEMGNYNSLRLLSKKLRDSHEDQMDEAEVLREKHRRLSMAGNVFVTLQDIMENDSVLKRHSLEMSDQRRKSQQGLTTVDARIKDWLNNNSQRRSSKTGSVPDMVAALQAPQQRSRSGSVPALNITKVGKSTQSAPGDPTSKNLSVPWMRKVRGGSLGNLVDEIILEHDDDSGLLNATNESVPEESKLLRGVFITAVDVPEENNDEETKTSQVARHEPEPPSNNQHVIDLTKLRGGKPLTRCQIKKLYEEQQHQELARLERERRQQEEQRNLRRLSALSMLVNQSRRSSLRSIEEEGHQANKLASGQTGQENPNSGESAGSHPAHTVENEKDKTDAPAPIRLTGLNRFKSIAKAVTVQNKATKGEGASRFKNLAAAAIVQNSAAQGKMPQCFMLNQVVSSPRDSQRDEIPALEASHRNAADVRIRPLQMPESVRLQHQKKWEELMVSVNRAVQWKVRALREDTGTLNPKQMLRQLKKSPREKQSLLPGSCKTTWAMKKYVKQEVSDVMTSWKPENMRRSRNRKLIEKVTLPQFIDRVKTTTSILSRFRKYQAGKEDEENEENGENGEKEQRQEREERVSSPAAGRVSCLPVLMSKSQVKYFKIRRTMRRTMLSTRI